MLSAQVPPGSGGLVSCQAGSACAHLLSGGSPVDGGDVWCLADLQHAHRLFLDSSEAVQVSLLGVRQALEGSWHRHFYEVTGFLALGCFGGPRTCPGLLNPVL